MPEWWSAAAPYLQAGGVALALLLGAANLGWLIVQARRSQITHALALEAHTWERERRDAEQKRARELEAKHEFWRQMREALASAKVAVSIPEGIDPSWIIEGEAAGHFQRKHAPWGEVMLWKWS